MPGLNEREIEISVEPHGLFISGKLEATTEEKTRGTVYTEPHSSEVFRPVDLPSEFDPDDVEPGLKEGILEITIPKVARN